MLSQTIIYEYSLSIDLVYGVKLLRTRECKAHTAMSVRLYAKADDLSRHSIVRTFASRIFTKSRGVQMAEDESGTAQ